MLPVAELVLQPADAALSSALPASQPTSRRRSVCWHSAHSGCTSPLAAVVAGAADSAVGVADAAGCASGTLANSGESRGLVVAALVAAVGCSRDAAAGAAVSTAAVVVAGDGGLAVVAAHCGGESPSAASE